VPYSSNKNAPFVQGLHKEPKVPLKKSLAARVSVEVLRKKYPSPKPAYTGQLSSRDYCVGGALCGELCLELGYPDSDPPLFPGAELIAEALCLCNSNLSRRQSLAFAHDVNQKNEEGSFEDAWSALEEALNYV
jgi:hypothetical protein